jgi:S1-C subfamily serine protease
VTAVNGNRIYDVDGLMLEVGRLPPESDVTLTVVRGGLTKPFVAQLAKFPVRGKNIVTAPSAAWRGMRIDYSTVLADVVAFDGFRGYLAGSVAVVDVATESPAWKAGLRPGQLITDIDNSAVRSPREFREAIAGQEGPVQLHVMTELSSRAAYTVQPEDEPESPIQPDADRVEPGK